MSDFVTDKSIEKIGGTELPSQPIQMPTLNVGASMEGLDEGDIFGDMSLPPTQSEDDKILEGLYASAQREPSGDIKKPTLGESVSDTAQEAYDYIGEMAKQTVGPEGSVTQAFVGGTLDAAQSFLNFNLDVSEWSAEKLGIELENTGARYAFSEKMLPRTDDKFVQFQRDMVRFMGTFVAGNKLSAGAAGATVTKNMINGMVTDFIASDPREEKVKALIRQHPELISTYGTIMSTKNLDAKMIERTNEMALGALGGLGFDIATKAIGKLAKSMANTFRNYRHARDMKGTNLDGVAKEIMGDVDAPDIRAELDIEPPPIPKLDTEVTKDMLKLYEGKRVAKDRAFNMNLHSFKTEEDVRKVFDALVDANLKQFKNQKGATKSLAELQEEASALGLTVDKLLRRKKGTPTWDAVNLAASQIMESSADDWILKAKMYKEGKIAIDDFHRATEMVNAITMQYSDMSTMSGRALQSLNAEKVRGRMSTSDRAKYIEEMQELFGEELDAIADAVTRTDVAEKTAIKNALKLKNGSLTERIILAINNYRLSSPITHTRNLVSNTAELAATVSDSAFQETISMLKGGSGQTQFGETFALAKGMFEGFGDAMVTIKNNITKGETTPIFADEYATKMGDYNRMYWNDLSSAGKAGSVLKNIMTAEISGKALGWSDQVFKNINYRGAIRQEALRRAKLRKLEGVARVDFIDNMLTNPTDAVHNAGLIAAREHTFTKKRQGYYKKLEGLVRDPMFRGFDRLLFPFIGTNLNILDTRLSRTPVLGMFLSSTQEALAKGGREAEKVLAKQATGAFILGSMGIALHKAGILQGSLSTNLKESQLAQASGLQPFSLKIGDDVINLDATDPVGGVVKFMADMTELYSLATEKEYKELDKIMSTAAGVFMSYYNPEFITDMTGSFIEAANKDRDKLAPIGHFIKSLPASAIPYSGLLRTINKPSELKDVRHAGGLSSWMSEAVMNMQKVVMPDGLPTKRNFLGDPIPAKEGLGWDMVSPFTLTQLDRDPILQAIYEIADADRLAQLPPDSDEKLHITMPRRTIIRKDIKGRAPERIALNANEYEELILHTAGIHPEFKKRGIVPLKTKLKEIMKSKQYVRGHDGIKKHMIHSVIKAYKEAGTKTFFLSSGKAEEYKRTMEAYLRSRGIR